MNKPFKRASTGLLVGHGLKRAVLMQSPPENIDYILHLADSQSKGDCEKRDCRQYNRDEIRVAPKALFHPSLEQRPRNDEIKKGLQR